jgi:protein-disulfide isomerase
MWSATKRPSTSPQAHGFPLELVQQVVRLVERSEYKRQQAAPVLKVTSNPLAWGADFPSPSKCRYKLERGESSRIPRRIQLDPFVLVLPDGKHIITNDEIISFGEKPFAEYRAALQQKADGPYRGTASKELELVEFADFQCPHCKEAQPNMEKLAVDFPNARIVFQNFPLPQHPAAAGAAAYGVCVNKLGGSIAFFKFAGAVFDGQDGLATADGATLTLNSAVTAAGLDPAKVEACSKTPEVAAQVKASAQLAKDVSVNLTPALMVNGRQIPAGAPYDLIKQIILFQEKLDGIKQ